MGINDTDKRLEIAFEAWWFRNSDKHRLKILGRESAKEIWTAGCNSGFNIGYNNGREQGRMEGER